jgi:hypothetical protein
MIDTPIVTKILSFQRLPSLCVRRDAAGRDVLADWNLGSQIRAMKSVGSAAEPKRKTVPEAMCSMRPTNNSPVG